MRLRELSQAVAHALEATCRNLEKGDTEQETAGQISHRLVRREIEPVAIQVAADGHNRVYRRRGSTDAKIEQLCLVQTTARRWGLHTTASRTMSFGAPPEELYREFEMAARITGMQMASSTARTKPADILTTSGGILRLAGFEHEWRLCPTGWLTGFIPVETMFAPGAATEPLELGQSIVWQGSIGAAACADTMLVTAAGPQLLTAPNNGRCGASKSRVSSSIGRMCWCGDSPMARTGERSRKFARAFALRAGMMPGGSGTSLTNMASTSSVPVFVVNVPASALLWSNRRPFIASKADSVPVFACTSPRTGLLGPTTSASVPSTPMTGKPACQTL